MPTAAFGLHYTDVTNPDSATPGASFLGAGTQLLFGSSVGPSGPSSFVALNYNQVSLEIHAGDGGASLLGHGGNGGSIGSSKVFVVSSVNSTTGVNTQTVNGPLTLTLAGDVPLIAGNGGDGFSSGGQGGSITGVSLLYRGGVDVGLGVSATTGHGGRGVSSTGGAGGNIAYDYFETALSAPNTTTTSLAFEAILQTGFGGEGNTGGAGGSIIGNGTAAPDAVATFVLVSAGYGGDGMHAGGAGGSVLNYHPNMSKPGLLSGTFTGAGELFYLAGNGGTTVAGAGGAGGSVTNSSPGNGAFIEGTDQGDRRRRRQRRGRRRGRLGHEPELRPALHARSAAGHHPRAVSAAMAPAAPGVTAARSPTSRSLPTAAAIPISPSCRFPSPMAPPRPPTSTASSRVTAARAPATSAARAAASSGQERLVGRRLCARRRGRRRWPPGRRRRRQRPRLPARYRRQGVNKGLVIAGAGGNAFAFVPNKDLVKLSPKDPGVPADTAPNQSLNAFGGVIGHGGNGGSINGFTQSGQTGAHIDLIAGNGGSTENYGTIFDSVSHVGNGGSVTNVTITGDIGNIDPLVPIKSYNDTADRPDRGPVCRYRTSHRPRRASTTRSAMSASSSAWPARTKA